MFELVKNIFRRHYLKKMASPIKTGLVPFSEIKSINVIVDVEEGNYDEIKDYINAWSRTSGKKVNIYYFDFNKLRKDELLLTSINTTIIRKDLNWFDMPQTDRLNGLLEEKSDVLISLIPNGNFPVEYVTKCAKARCKVGRCAFPGHAYDIVIAQKEDGSQGKGIKEIFDCITFYLSKVN